LEDYFPMPDNNLEWFHNFYFPGGIDDLEYIADAGIRYKNYYEICIKISHPSYGGYAKEAWKKCPLKFQIDSTRIEVGTMSKFLFSLIRYAASISLIDQNKEIEYSTIKILLGEGKDYQAEVIKVLFYLNTYYFKDTQFEAKLVKLYLFDNWGDEYDARDPFDIYPEHLRKIERQEKDFISVEPLNLYYNAHIEKGEQKFLSLYRILEFFMQRAILNKIQTIRYDTNISEDSLDKMLNLRYEEKQLANLIEDVLDKAHKQKVVDLAIDNKLIKEGYISNISSSLYNFRNSLVHAKENELEKTKFPNPFEVNHLVDKWISVIEIISLECIRKYNQK
ncbi:MAG: hypothetical protein EGP82_00485, partial [Odoribacter splanchnicus]|nr:hypothetical protein [Odoribacter splanchnicus]